MKARPTIPLGFALFLCAVPASAQSLFPITTGHVWEYVDSGERSTVSTFTQTEMVRGRSAVRQENDAEQIVGSDVYWNYWSEDEAGGILLHGFWRPVDGWGLAYEPPLQWIGSQTTLGSTWKTSCAVLDFVSGLEEDTIVLEGLIMSENESITVPAGTFGCTVVRLTQLLVPTLAKLGRYSLTGQRLPEEAALRADGDPYQQAWYAAAIGMVQVSYGIEPDPPEISLRLSSASVESATNSWSSLKAAFGSER